MSIRLSTVTKKKMFLRKNLICDVVDVTKNKNVDLLILFLINYSVIPARFNLES